MEQFAKQNEMSNFINEELEISSDEPDEYVSSEKIETKYYDCLLDGC